MATKQVEPGTGYFKEMEVTRRCDFCGGYMFVPFIEEGPYTKYDHTDRRECATHLKLRVEGLQAQVRLLRSNHGNQTD